MASGDGSDNRSLNGHGSALRLESYLPHRLNLVSSMITQAMAKIADERFGLAIAEWRVVAALGQFGEITAKDVGDHAHMHKTKVSRAVAELERRRLVQRRTNRQDLREAFLSLSPTGRALYEEMAPLALDFSRQLSDGLHDQEQRIFEKVLAHLTARSSHLVRNAPAIAE
jgi:DNA-binding MarR family transcriptional regulator